MSRGRISQNELDALLLHQPGDGGEQRPLGLLGQAEELLNFGLAAGLAGAVVCGEVIGDQRIARGVVVLLVDAVENAVELVVDHVHHALQSVGEVGVVQLARVGGGDGGDGRRP